MKTLTLFAVLAAFSLSAFGQVATCNTATVPLCTAGNAGSDVQIKPQAVPTSTTIVTAQEAYLKGVTVTNPTAGPIAFSLCDRQAVAVCVLGAVSITANTTYILVWPDGRLYWCPLGFTVLASGAGLTMEAKWLQ
jgi:hypothetical protein